MTTAPDRFLLDASVDDALRGRRLPRPVREFLDTEAAGGIFLLVATVVALVWANSPYQDSYHHLIEAQVGIELGATTVTMSVEHLVNDLLMAVFFFVVGLEIKREFVTGELRTWSVASLPVLCALGGMVVPALVYAAVNAGGAGSTGWGIPMATDIAFAVGVLALFGERIPPALKLFLLTLAVVDDLGAIAVIALVYTPSIEVVPLLAAVGLLGVIAALRAARILWWPAYLLAAAGVWVALYASGVHATIAGVAVAMLVPARPRTPTEVVRDLQLDLTEDLGPEDIRSVTRLMRSTLSTGDRLNHALHPLVSFVIVPLFALVNAGVTLQGGPAEGAPTAVALGTAAGLVVGKPLGILLAAGLAVRFGISRLPSETRWSQLAGAAALAGIGFTVSLFVANLAFTDQALVDAAKVAILAASAVAAVAGALVLLLAGRTAGRRAGPATASAIAPAGVGDGRS